MQNNYNNIAKYYDFISRLIFGQSIIKAQVCLLKFIDANRSVLIVGGGTGWVLEELSKLRPEGLLITYVEISSEMILLAKKRNCKQNKVLFINLPVEKFISENKYDVIMTPFFFDNFSANKIELIFNILNSLLKKDGLWLFADFITEKNKTPIWQSCLLKTMYLFFKITTNIEAKELINMDVFFAAEYNQLFEAFFYSRFIKSVVYKKTNNVE